MVRDAVAFGVEDERIGQVVALVVSGDVDPDELRAVLAKALPTYMVPRHITVRDELPRSPNGKFDRALLRRELAPA